MLPEGWREVRLGELCTVSSGGTPNRSIPSYFDPPEVPWVKTGDLNDSVVDSFDEHISLEGLANSAAQVFPVDTVLVAMYGATAGRLGMLMRPAATNQAAAGLVATPGRSDPRWLFYSLLHSRARLIDLANGAAQQNLNAGLIKDHLVSAPPLSEQRAIAEVLGALDDKIAANTALVQLLRETALAFASRVSAFGKVSDLARHTRSQVAPADMTDEVVHHYSLPAFDAGSGPDVVPPETIKSSKFRVATPSVLVSKLNPRFPRIWDLPTLDEHSALASTEFVVLEPLAVSSSLLWALIAQPAVSVELEAQVAGTSGSHQRVKPEAILAATVGDPSTLSAADLEGITSCSARAHAVHLETSRLTATRDALLPALMSGRLTVRDAEALAEEAGL